MNQFGNLICLLTGFVFLGKRPQFALAGEREIIADLILGVRTAIFPRRRDVDFDPDVPAFFDFNTCCFHT